VPVEGLTEDSQRAFEENFRTYTMKKEEIEPYILKELNLT
jgi:hypothetical protein